MESLAPIGKYERYGLRLVFGGPIWTWVSLASLIGVKVDPRTEPNASVLQAAETQAKVAANRFALSAPIAMLLTLLLMLLLPKETIRMQQFFYGLFEVVARGFLGRGVWWGFAEAFASASCYLVAVMTGLFNVIVFAAVPVYLLRRTALAAAPAVALALSAQSGRVDKASFERYPRVAIAVETILSPRKRRRKN